jgi:hypothetical protein
MKYSERWGIGWIPSLGTTALVAMVMMLPIMAARYQFVRDSLPAPGEGPSRDVMEGGKWSLELWALSHEQPSGRAAPQRVFARMAVRFRQLQHHFTMFFLRLIFRPTAPVFLPGSHTAVPHCQPAACMMLCDA